MEASNFLAELAEGWREFSSRTWLWVIVLQFGFVNAIMLGVEGVLGPAIAKEHLGGAAAWGLILTAQSLGSDRRRPDPAPPPAAQAPAGRDARLPAHDPVPARPGGAAPVRGPVPLAALAGIGIETFRVLWETTIQQEIPQEKLSRVSSYDALGSFALIPLGLAIVGPRRRRSSERAKRSSAPQRSA